MKNISLNFGSIKDTVFRYSSKTIMSEGKNSTFVDLFINEVKNNPILKIQYLIYKNLENSNFQKEYLAERYLNQNINLVKDCDWNDIIKENKSFRIDILKNFHVEGNRDKEEMYESIHTLIKSKSMKNFTDFDEENRAYEYVINYLTKKEPNNIQENTTPEENEIPKLLSWKYVTELAVNSFNDRYAHLSESEQSLLKILMSDSEYKKNYLQDLKQENLNLINGLLIKESDDEVKGNLTKFKNKIQVLKEDNVDESIINLYELKMNLEN
jgi:hypothetical protein